MYAPKSVLTSVEIWTKFLFSLLGKLTLTTVLS